jgi:hypothetical protein
MYATRNIDHHDRYDRPDKYKQQFDSRSGCAACGSLQSMSLAPGRKSVPAQLLDIAADTDQLPIDR